MTLANGTSLGPYEIVAPLGAGGMGEVYRAKDTRLDRIVALKVLPPDRMSDADARVRFEREAKSIAALNHPNICAIHDVGLSDAATAPYLVMELLEGQTLQERLLRGPLDIDRVVDYGAALADALDMAHARGLIHRDLKPANIFITSRGIPKILDFGLAKALEPGDASGAGADVTRRHNDALTELGTTVGTVAYMSPEQLRGEPLDVRSDLFSFGIVLYEMATGQRAFPGATSAVVSAAILTQEPLSPTVARPELPPRLEETILKALEKDRSVRCQSAAELRADLMRLKRHSGAQIMRTAGAMPPMPPPTAIATLSGPATNAGIPGITAPDPSQTAGSGTTPTRRRAGIGLAVVGGAAILAGAYWLGAGQGIAPPPSASTTAAPAVTPATPSAAATSAPPSAPETPPTTAPATRPTPSSIAAVDPPTVGLADRGRTGPPLGPRGARGAGGRRGLGPGGPALISVLQTLPPLPFDLAYAARDDRAREMAMQLRGALTAAGWTNVNTAEVPDPPPALAVFIPQASPSATALVNWARRAGFNPEVRMVPRIPRLRIVIGR